MDKACLRCGKRAVNPPLCLACLLEVDDKEFNRWSMIAALIDAPDYVESDAPDYEGNECKMCGKPTADGRPDGFCSSCRQVYNG